MKVTIEGHHFDTKKAPHHWGLSYWDGNNNHTGDVYLSSKGVWYVYTPSQWANQHSWMLMDASEILTEYDSYLDDEEKSEIAELANLEWE